MNAKYLRKLLGNLNTYAYDHHLFDEYPREEGRHINAYKRMINFFCHDNTYGQVCKDVKECQTLQKTFKQINLAVTKCHFSIVCEKGFKRLSSGGFYSITSIIFCMACLNVLSSFKIVVFVVYYSTMFYCIKTICFYFLEIIVKIINEKLHLNS